VTSIASSSRSSESLRIDCGTCVLRPFQPGDAESITPLLDDRDVWINLSDRVPHPYRREDADAFIAAARQKMPVENFAICVDDRAVGSIGFFLGTGISRVSAEVGYWLGKPYWGRGIISSALPPATAYAIEQFKLTRVFALLFTHNVGSMRALEKAGYVREGFMKQATIKDGIVHDEYLYACYANRLAAP
jgi:ribosomal-protein-alanine N-acetyltransferase